jgi:hypothetical protein
MVGHTTRDTRTTRSYGILREGDPLVFEEDLDGPCGQPHIDLGADMGADFGDDFESFAWPTMRERSALYRASASLLRVAEAIKTDGVRFD